MKKLKLFKTLLIPSLGVLTLGTIAVEATSCSCAIFHVTAVEVDPQQMVLSINETREIQAIVYPENATDKSVSWASDNETVATVDENGQVTAVAVGTANITVTTRDGGKTANCAVTVVEPIHVESVTLDKHNLSLVVGDNDYLTATISPTDATDPSVSWASDNETVATVENGKVTAVGKGTTTITVTTNDGHYTDTCVVTVTPLSYICVEANADSTLTLNNGVGNNPDLQYSMDGGASWNTYSAAINIDKGKNLYLKGNNPAGWSHDTLKYTVFVIKGDVSISGNVMGLLDNGATSGEEGDITAIPCDCCFYDLFRDSTGITSVSDDFLPATVLKCNCYRYMFNGCSSLTAAPELPATNLDLACYHCMFYGCSNLTTAPKLTATTLAEGCYYGMFKGCTSLIQAPELPATTLATSCYSNMFYYCSSLTTAPDLPATSLATSCYEYMFAGCTSINSVKISYTGIPSGVFNYWVLGVAATGIFYYRGSYSAQDFGFPPGWSKNPDFN